MTNTAFVLTLANILVGNLHFKDCVIVTKGFYQDCRGVVEEEWNDSQYDVRLTCKNETFNARFTASELKKCEK